MSGKTRVLLSVVGFIVNSNSLAYFPVANIFSNGIDSADSCHTKYLIFEFAFKLEYIVSRNCTLENLHMCLVIPKWAKFLLESGELCSVGVDGEFQSSLSLSHDV